jgi:hypothetical protein
MPQCSCGKHYYPESTGEGPCHETCSGCGDIISEDRNWYLFDVCEECFDLLSQDEAFNQFYKGIESDLLATLKTQPKYSPQYRVAEKFQEMTKIMKGWFE